MEPVIVLMRVLASSERLEGAPTGWQERLAHNTTAAHQLLTRDEYSSVRDRLSSVRKEKLPTCHSSDAHAQWTYVLEGLSLLLCLKELLIEAENQDQCQRGSAAPRALLSVSDNKVIRNLLQFIVTLGLYPYLLPGVGLPLSLRSSSPDESVTKVEGMRREGKAWHLYVVAKVLIEVTEEVESLRNIVSSTAFSDMLSTFVQIGFAPPEKPAQKLSSSPPVAVRSSIHTPADITYQATPITTTEPCLLPSDREWCMTALQRLLDQTHQPTVVRELLMLQGMPRTSNERVSKKVGSPAWLRRACGRLLSQRLMKKNGVLCVLQGILGAVSGKKQSFFNFNFLSLISQKKKRVRKRLRDAKLWHGS